ncbi:unnamed protein product, partial [Chrysoparadoxa australica]
RNGRNRVFNFDVEIVSRDGQTFDEARRENEADRISISHFRIEIRVAAAKLVELTSRVVGDGAVLSRRYARVLALSQGRGRVGASARIVKTIRALGQIEQADRLVREQLDHVRCTHRTLVRPAETQIVDRSP